MRRTALLALLVVVMGTGVACVPVPQPPPPPPCQVQAVATRAPTSGAPKLTQVSTLPGAITMATRAGDATLYVGTLKGCVYAVNGSGTATTVLDLTSRVGAAGELGLLGMTFSPDGTKLYVHYSAVGSGDTTVDEFAVGTAAPAVATFGGVGSRRPVLTAPGLEANHNGGSLLFGHDTPTPMLYLATGDGGSGNDDYSTHGPGGNGQNIDTLLGKVLRIDPTDPSMPGTGLGLSYSAPADNPFVGISGADEVWSFGLRNPFRMSFDRTTGDLWIGDVGQSAREEIDFVAFGDATHPGGRSANFGWNRFEGKIPGPETSLPPNSAGGAVVDPIFDIDRSQGDCAIIGGYVYRGAAIPALVGKYLYTDNCNPQIRVLTPGSPATSALLGQSAGGASSFGEDNAGELYVLTLGQGIFKITP